MEQPAKEIHYKVNLLYAEEIEYKVNLLKQDRIIGGKYLALADNGVNGTILGLDVFIIYFNNDGKRVSIGIVGDHQLTANRLCCQYSIAKSSVGWIELYWPQGAQVNTHQNSILLIIQMHQRGCLVSDVAKRHGGKQMIMTTNGILLPLVINNTLAYLGHCHPTAKQLCDIRRKEFMTLKSDWDLSKFDDIEGATDLHIQQFPPISIDATDSFYDTEGNIRANNSDLKEDYVVSNASSTSSGSRRRRSYRLRPRKEKQKKRHGLKGKKEK